MTPAICLGKFLLGELQGVGHGLEMIIRIWVGHLSGCVVWFFLLYVLNLEILGKYDFNGISAMEILGTLISIDLRKSCEAQ